MHLTCLINHFLNWSFCLCVFLYLLLPFYLCIYVIYLFTKFLESFVDSGIWSGPSRKNDFSRQRRVKFSQQTIQCFQKYRVIVKQWSWASLQVHRGCDETSKGLNGSYLKIPINCWPIEIILEKWNVLYYSVQWYHM